jgi:hypothetical protein
MTAEPPISRQGLLEIDEAAGTQRFEICSVEESHLAGP